MRLQLGEQERGLKFNMRTLKNIKELTGGDPFTFFEFKDELDDQLKQLSVIVYAALLANNAIKKEESDYTQDDVALWVEDMGYTDIVNLSQFIRQAYSVEASGEGSADTRA